MKTNLYKFSSSIDRVSGAAGINALELEGNKYEIGTNSQYSTNMANIEELHKYYPLLIKEVKKRGSNITNISLTLPLNYFIQESLKQQAGFENGIDKLIERVKKNVENVENVEVYPQGLSALFKYRDMFDEDMTGKIILFVDGGFNSLILGAVRFTQNSWELIKQETILDHYGVRDLLVKDFASELKLDHPNLTNNVHVLNKIFQEEEINDGFKKVSILKEKNLAIQNYVGDILKQIEVFVTKNNINYDALAIVGGLSYMLGGIDVEVPSFLIQDKAEFLTVMGILERNPEATVIDAGFGDVKVAEVVKEKEETKEKK